MNMGNVHLVTGYAGQAHVTAADQGAFQALMLGSGQFVFDKGETLSATAISNNLIRIYDGDIFMQGRYIRLNEGKYVDLAIENGRQGYLRNDLIVARYTKEAGTGIEDVNLVVIKGTAVTSNPSDPDYTEGNLVEDNDSLNDMLLYRVVLNGINIQELVPLFAVQHVDFGSAMPKTGGAFTGTVKAGSSFQAVGTSLLRNSKLVSAETTPTVNGEINWTYG